MNILHPTFTARSDKIPGWITQVIRLVQQVALEHGIEFVMVGAMARDLLLQGVFGLAPGKQTIDLDFGFAVENWEQFLALRSALIATNNFQPTDRVSQRILYKGEWRVDLIPFGGVEDENGAIAWPPSRDIVLNVAGFEDALASAIRVQVDADLIVPVASLPGLAVLKLVAWADQRDKANSDADDLHRLMADYGNAGNENRLYGEELHFFEDAKFDFELAGARLLGKDVASIVTTMTAARITDVLGSEKQLNRLLLQMLQAVAVIDERVPMRYAELLNAFREGFLNR